MKVSDVSVLDEDAILREVFVVDDSNKTTIESRTELTAVQIENINKAQVIARIFNSKLLVSYLNGFMIKQKSLNRKSLGEFVQIVKSRTEDILSKAKGVNWMG